MTETPVTRAPVPCTLAALNRMDRDAFVDTLASIFEHSPWIPAACVDARPFPSVEALHRAMVGIVARAGEGEKLALLRAHPELADKTRKASQLTAESAAEQASLGLNEVDADEAMRFDSLNRRYRERFGFPFIIAVRGQRDRQAILRGLEARTGNSQAQEFETALGEVAKIAWFRLSGLIQA